MATLKLQTASNKEYVIKDSNEINSGGEGVIYSLGEDKTLVAKIYHKGKKVISKQKFNYLQKLDKTLFITPKELLTKNNKTVGYTMQLVNNSYFPISALFNTAYCNKNGISAKIKLEIAKKLSKAVEVAHSQQVIVGDLNQFNILVNKKGDVKLIDTDSYQIPSEVHTGIMLDEIRDFYYQGKISEQSDFFALAIIIFYMFTFTHPYKGIHSKYKGIENRMINKISVLTNDNDLKIPKCYQSISDKTLLADFKKIFNNGDRFLLNLSNAEVSKTKSIKLTTVDIFEEENLIITKIAENLEIINANFQANLSYIETNNNFIIYDTSIKGKVFRKFVIEKQENDKLYLGYKNIILNRNNKLNIVKNATEMIEITNINFEQNSLIHKFENILISIKNNLLHTIYLDEIINTSIKNERTAVLERSFRTHTGFLQNIGGQKRILYNTGRNLALVKTDKNIKEINQINNCGVISEIENDKLNYKLFKINDLKIEYSKNINSFGKIAYIKSDLENGFILNAEDNLLEIYRTQDFAKISETKCSVINQQTQLFYTKAGIIAANESEVYLINQKM